MKYILALIIFIAPNILFADDLEVSRIELEAKKKIHISKELKLDADESDKFWDIYSNYERELSAQNKISFDLIRKYSKGYENNAITDNQAQEMLISFFNTEEKKLTIKKSYITQYQSVLSDKKVFQFYQIDNKVDTIIKCDIANRLPIIKTN